MADGNDFLLGELKGRMDAVENGVQGIQGELGRGFGRLESLLTSHSEDDTKRFDDLYSKINAARDWRNRLIGIWAAVSFILATGVTFYALLVK